MEQGGGGCWLGAWRIKPGISSPFPGTPEGAHGSGFPVARSCMSAGSALALSSSVMVKPRGADETAAAAEEEEDEKNREIRERASMVEKPLEG